MALLFSSHFGKEIATEAQEIKLRSKGHRWDEQPTGWTSLPCLSGGSFEVEEDEKGVLDQDYVEIEEVERKGLS